MSKLITQNDLTGVLNEVLPSPMMIQTVQYISTITWYSTSNPFGDVYTDIEIDGWTPINLSYLIGGSLSSFVFGSQIELKENNGVMCAHGYFRMTGQTPSSTTQNSVIWTVVYIKNAPMTLPIADYIVEQGTSGNWTYRKWNSGIAEFWGYVVIPSVPSAWSSSGYTFNYPITLTQTSSWYVQQLNYQIEVTYLSNVGTNSAVIETKATSAVTNAQIRISFKGRWK